jgi:hypothetical protein
MSLIGEEPQEFTAMMKIPLLRNQIKGLVAKNWQLTTQLDKALNRIVEQNIEICRLRERLEKGQG